LEQVAIQKKCAIEIPKRPVAEPPAEAEADKAGDDAAKDGVVI